MKDIAMRINGVMFDKLTIAENHRDMTLGQEKKTQMDNGEGMVYVFGEDCTQSFINGNIYLDFDVIMVDSQDKITAIHTMKKAVPKDGEAEKEFRSSLTYYPSPEPYRYVFELKAGMASKIGAKVGDRLDVDYLKLLPFRNAENIRYAFQLKKVTPKKGWIAPLLQRMNKVVNLPDAVRDLNLEFAGGQLDKDILLSAGWIQLCGIDTEESENEWLQKEFCTDGKRGCARLCLSVKGHYRHLYILPFSEDGAYLPVDNGFDFTPAVQLLRPDIAGAQIVPQPQTLTEELEIITMDLINHSVKEEWNENQKNFYIWSRELFRLNEKSKFYRYRLLNGMLRFDNFCNYDFVLNGALCAAAELGYQWATAKLVVQSLTYASESTNPSFWNDLGFALDHLGEKEAAFYCFANAWNQEFSTLYANNLWWVGTTIIPEMREAQNWDSLFTVASMMLSAISDKATVKDQVEVLCMVGLVHENQNDFEEAALYYEAAYDIYKRKNGSKKSFWALRWDFPVLYQALMRAQMDDKKECLPYVKAQLKTFPQTPLESGFEGRLPIEFVEGDGHGDHWESVTEDQLKDPQAFFEVMVREGKLDSMGIELPQYEQGDGLFTRGIGFRYSDKRDSASPIESYFVFGERKDKDARQFVSAFPVFRKGAGTSIISQLRSMNVWGNAIEATVEFDLRKHGTTTLAFFLPNYCGEFLRLKQDTAYRIELGVFAYVVSRFEEQEFKIDKGPMLAEEKLRLRKEGKDDNIDSVSLHMTNEYCNISRSFSGWADDVSITAPIERIEHFSFLGGKCLTLWLKFDERGAGITLPVFLKEGNLDDGYRPQVGDVINCHGWLQGWVHESHEIINVSDAVEEDSEDSDDFCDNDDEFDFEHSLLAGVRGTGYNLDALAIRALEQKCSAEEIQHCPAALPGDADLSCRINGSVKFVKIMTGYFENEDECRAAWRRFRKQCVSRPDGKPVHLIAVVGIKLCDDDQYKIYYNRFSELNPAAKEDEDEIDLEQENTLCRRTPQEMSEIMANAWRNLDVTGVRDILAEEYEYTSMWVFETMHGADKYLEYLAGKFKTIRNGNSRPVVDAVRSDEHYAEIELQQSVNGKTNNLMLQFEIKEGKIVSGWMGEPSFRRVK